MIRMTPAVITPWNAVSSRMSRMSRLTGTDHPTKEVGAPAQTLLGVRAVHRQISSKQFRHSVKLPSFWIVLRVHTSDLLLECICFIPFRASSSTARSARERLKGLIKAWIRQRDLAARYGCPTGTLAVELDKRDEGDLDVEAGRVIRLLLTWVERQFRELGQPEPDGLALTLVGAYQGMSLLANALRDPGVMEREGTRLLAWLDSLEAT
jgi:hypothetical protein